MKKITRVQAPKFRVGRYMLNEYELRTMMLEVAQGNPSHFGRKVTDRFGNTALICADGTLHFEHARRFPDLEIISDMKCEMMRIRHALREERDPYSPDAHNAYIASMKASDEETNRRNITAKEQEQFIKDWKAATGN